MLSLSLPGAGWLLHRSVAQQVVLIAVLAMPKLTEPIRHSSGKTQDFAVIADNCDPPAAKQQPV